ncbi:hypothetical protein SLA2020_156870 [Shorea laevis]
MWTIILEKFSFKVPKERKETILDHMNALYRDYSKDYQDKSLQSKANRSKHSMPLYTSTKSFVRLKQEMIEFKQLKKQKGEGQLSINDDEMFEKVLGPEKHGYLRAYGLRKNITENFGSRPTKGVLLKRVEATRKEATEQIEEARKEANE